MTLIHTDAADCCLTGRTKRPASSRRLWTWEGGCLVGRRWIECDTLPFASRSVAVLSSRSGGRHRSGWLAALRSVILHTERSGRTVVTCVGTACDRYLAVVAHDRSIRWVDVILPGKSSMADWLRRSPPSRSLRPSRSRVRNELRVSPQIGSVAVWDANHRTRVPLADRMLCSLSDDVYILSARPGGGIARLVSAGFQSGAFRGKRLFLAGGVDGIPAAMHRQWVRQGGIDWSVLPAAAVSGHRNCAVRQPIVAPILPPTVAHGDFLVHWTRRQRGPWPDQSEANYIRSVLFEPSSAGRSPLDALRRIVRMQKLVATGRLNRGGKPVVCLTARSLSDFPNLRKYRAHQSRWDFELYGIAMSREWLQQRGARPVIYGDDHTWSTLPAPDQPFFQLNNGRGPGSDWQAEAEWRVVGDLDLQSLSARDAFVFVPTIDEARAPVWCKSRSDVRSSLGREPQENSQGPEPPLAAGSDEVRNFRSVSEGHKSEA